MKSPRFLILAAIANAALLGCGGAGEPGAGEPDAGALLPDASPPTEYATCGEAFGGPMLGSQIVEAQPGYAELLASIAIEDVSGELSLSGQGGFLSAVMNYMLGTVGQSSIAAEDARALGPMGEALVAAFAEGGEADVELLRRGLHHFYYCSHEIPRTLTGFRNEFGDYREWTRTDVACGAPKNGPRRIYRSQGSAISVAETIGPGDEVREIEVIFSDLRPDGQLAFAVYTPDEELTDRSSFATFGDNHIVLAAPYACMSCHVDPKTDSIADLNPVGTGAGCQ